ncbi:hypothetical protein SCHPADRAFT_835136, partial [Schizopora paradoxa]
MVAAGRTQYLTEVQGMPTSVEDRLVKRITNFMWKDSRQRPVSIETMYRPIHEGGLGLVDIRRRNEALGVKWLQRFLHFEKRPKWTYIGDALIAKNSIKKEKGISNSVKSNIFLQTWKTNRGNKCALPQDLKDLFKTANKFGLLVDQIHVQATIAELMPIWYHIKAARQIRKLTRSKASICLRDVHSLRTV